MLLVYQIGVDILGFPIYVEHIYINEYVRQSSGRLYNGRREKRQALISQIVKQY
ncbi:hypothetical protein SAMN05444369_11027 [Capnocytophaga haemolytica]|uniref:Uncharacterized protein n=1 Tax=Capnocytophaga haemolytica TaxID=45243 RepID=A0AAX2GYI0_9FLAO|nr:hypothetical protein SAMN05444369_11027 [Capnocytophaga haemolytica]SNV01652.1 Uncharacterised protein [Capnocytophaga haemolytica]